MVTIGKWEDVFFEDNIIDYQLFNVVIKKTDKVYLDFLRQYDLVYQLKFEKEPELYKVDINHQDGERFLTGSMDFTEFILRNPNNILKRLKITSEKEVEKLKTNIHQKFNGMAQNQNDEKDYQIIGNAFQNEVKVKEEVVGQRMAASLNREIFKDTLADDKGQVKVFVYKNNHKREDKKDPDYNLVIGGNTEYSVSNLFLNKEEILKEKGDDFIQLLISDKKQESIKHENSPNVVVLSTEKDENGNRKALGSGWKETKGIAIGNAFLNDVKRGDKIIAQNLSASISKEKFEKLDPNENGEIKVSVFENNFKREGKKDPHFKLTIGGKNQDSYANIYLKKEDFLAQPGDDYIKFRINDKKPENIKKETSRNIVAMSFDKNDDGKRTVLGSGWKEKSFNDVLKEGQGIDESKKKLNDVFSNESEDTAKKKGITV